MKILAIEQEVAGADWSNQEDTLAAEAYRVHKLQQSGFVREIYFNNNHCAVIVIEAESARMAQEVLNELPLVKKGLITFNVMQLNPYNGLDRIIRDDIKESI
ncbi:MAG: hypothetical protein N4A72_18320 [Bacteroidales bacterium]|jgi:hypothetical protein|nr:hypothetical protein [Bacteroidales bacterium]